jgi:hypothetical protein
MPTCSLYNWNPQGARERAVGVHLAENKAFRLFLMEGMNPWISAAIEADVLAA